MGIEYLTSDEIKDKKQHIYGKFFKHKGNEFLMSGVISGIFEKYVKKDAQIIELGCSNGGTLMALKNLGYNNLSAIDIDNYLEYPELSSNFSAVDLNKEKLSQPDGSIDTVLALQILEHLENPFHFARECARVIKRGGVAIISVPNGNTILDKLQFLFSGRLLAYTEKNNHITFLQDIVFKKAFRDFDILEMKYGSPWIPWLRPRRLNKKLPKGRWLSYNKLYILRRK